MRHPLAHPSRSTCALAVGAVLGVGTPACDSAPAEPNGEAPAPTATVRAYDPDWEATQDPHRKHARQQLGAADKRKIHALPVARVTPSTDDPLLGSFSLEQATEGLPSGSGLEAVLDTSLGELRCALWPDKAPLTVANFVGLARGLRPWRSPHDGWVKRPAFDGTRFDRVWPGLAIQGGSPDGSREGGPGYVIADEIWEDANHDRAGLLCMAPTRPNTGGMQFLVTDASTLHLDGSHTIFGECAPLEVVHRIAAVPAERGLPREPVTIRSVRIERHAGGVPSGSP